MQKRLWRLKHKITNLELFGPSFFVRAWTTNAWWIFTTWPPTLKFLGTTKAYFACQVGPNFQISFDLCLYWVSVVRVPELNTSYLTNSYVVFTLKMESVFKITFFGTEMMVKSGLQKIIVKFHDGLQSFCCPVQKICPERQNWPGKLAGISEGAGWISKWNI